MLLSTVVRRISLLGIAALLLALGGLRIVDRFGDWSRTPLTSDAALQVYVCEAELSRPEQVFEP